MFIAALFTMTKIWKQPKFPSVDKKIKNKKKVIDTENKLMVVRGEGDWGLSEKR